MAAGTAVSEPSRHLCTAHKETTVANPPIAGDKSTDCVSTSRTSGYDTSQTKRCSLLERRKNGRSTAARSEADVVTPLHLQGTE
jgi:hypothetical protein